MALLVDMDLPRGRRLGADFPAGCTHRDGRPLTADAEAAHSGSRRGSQRAHGESTGGSQSRGREFDND